MCSIWRWFLHQRSFLTSRFRVLFSWVCHVYRWTLPFGSMWFTFLTKPLCEIQDIQALHLRCVSILLECMCMYLYMYMFGKRRSRKSDNNPTKQVDTFANQDSYLPALDARETRELWSIACPKSAASEPLGWKMGSGFAVEPPKEGPLHHLAIKGPPHRLAVSTSTLFSALTSVSPSPQ